MKHLIRTRFGKDIVAEVQFPVRQTGKVAILASGLPSAPPKRRVFEFLRAHGYVVIAFRYRGTWESGGYFLEVSPAKDVEIIVSQLTEEKGIRDIYNQTTLPVKVREIHLFGNSFGGPAVLLNSGLKKVTKVVAMSPVLDWTIESESEPFEFFVSFTREAFGSAYRLKKSTDWKKLLDSPLYDPVQNTKLIDGKKVLIIGTSDDTVTPSSIIPGFASVTGATYYIKPKGGHLGLTNITQQFFWKKIEQFLKTK
jgi:pimeloyl-ACP methyl ester carboxylesterase